MKQTIRLFCMGLRQTVNDGMLLMLLPAPFLIGIFVKWGIPFANQMINQYFGFSLQPWYGLADAFLLTLSPLMTAMVSAFLLLDERDEGTGAYYQITPVQGYVYLMARIGLPMAWALVCNMIVGLVFGISGLDVWSILFAGFAGTGAGTACAMMIVTMAGNRVEGLAISKLTGVSLIGILAVWFIPAPYQYLAAFLPSFWAGEMVRQGVNIITFAGGIFTCVLWIFIFIKGFLKKVS